MNDKSDSLTYQDSGVNIDTASELVESIKTLSRRTHRNGVLNGIGGFGALFEIPAHYKKPILVSGTDGVGTKLRLAIEMNQHQTIGIDLVAMCVNDILTLGAEPLFFLDYFATGKLDVKTGRDIIAGIAEGCQQAGAALIGGETAEMPGLYNDKDYDLAGFTVGVVEKDQIIDGTKIKAGDSILALASSGPHSNGYSLIRKILERNGHRLDQAFGDSTLGQSLLTPTRIYVKSVRALLDTIPVHGIAHITGGGLTENIPRILPPKLAAQLNTDSWTWPEVFQWLQAEGNVAMGEMFRTFNLGIGMILVVPAAQKAQALHTLHQAGENAWELGSIVSNDANQPRVILD